MNIKGVEILSEPLFQEGAYVVYVGYIAENQTKDIPHYLVINGTTSVVEGSSARLFEARAIASAFSKELAEQDDHISKGQEIVERAPQPTVEGSFDGGTPWKQH